MMPILNDLMLVVNGSVFAAILVKVTVVFTVAFTCTRLARRSPAAVRHLFLAAAFALVLCLPIATFVAPTIRIAVPIAAQQTVASSSLQGIPADVLRTPSASKDVAVGTAAAPSPWLSMYTLLLAGWGLTSLVFLLPIGTALRQMQRLRNSGTSWVAGQSMLDTLAIEAGIHRRIKLLLHEAVYGPMTCGVAHPTVLLPAEAPKWAGEDLRRAIIHELEHVRRGDWVTQCFARAMCACYWFHPLVWMAWRRLVLEAERACDDAVLRSAEATCYADQLVALAERLSSTSKRPVLAMANPRDLTTRVRAVLDQGQRRGPAGRFSLALTCATAGLFVIAVSSLKIVSASQLQAASVQGNPTPVARLHFDAASLRPIPAEQMRDGWLPIGLHCRGVDGELFPQPGTQNDGPVPQGRCTGRDTTKSFIREAYASPLYIQFRIIGLPAEFEITSGTSLFYQIQAVAANPSRVTSLELQEMLQSLLMDRFSLKVHRETREVDGFLLTVAKGGIKFKETSLDEEPMSQGLQDEGRPRPSAGGIVPAMIKGRFGMKQFARGMPSLVVAPVADKTGLPGIYDITFLFDAIEGTGGGRGGGGGPPQYSTSIPKALEEQLGLHLEPAKVPVEFLFIDHIEKATEN